MALLRQHHVEAVLHCAARSLVGQSMKDPGLYYAENVVGGVALLDALREAGVDRIVFSSTAAVYGEPEKVPIRENAPTRPVSPYGASKLAFEGAMAWYAAYGLALGLAALLQRGRRQRALRRAPRPGDASHPQHPARGTRAARS